MNGLKEEERVLAFPDVRRLLHVHNSRLFVCLFVVCLFVCFQLNL